MQISYLEISKYVYNYICRISDTSENKVNILIEHLEI